MKCGEHGVNLKDYKLESLSDECLIVGIRQLVEIERLNLVKFLHHLREIDRRRLYSQLRHPSLFDFLVNDLRFSEPAAVRRISAMRLMKEMPEIEMKISSGTISLSNLAMARMAFSKARKAGQPLSLAEKKKWIRRLENSSARTAKKMLGELEGNSETRREIRYEDVANEPLRDRLLELKGRFAHISPQITLEELLMRVCDGLLGPTDKDQNAPSTSTVRFDINRRHANNIQSEAAAKREVWRRDNSRCSNCKSTYAVQVDHIIPVAAGGLSTVENMRLLCRSCNQRAAINYFGMKKMGTYVDKVESRGRKDNPN